MTTMTPEIHTAMLRLAVRWRAKASHEAEALVPRHPEVLARRAESLAVVEALLLMPMGAAYRLNDVVATVRQRAAAEA